MSEHLTDEDRELMSDLVSGDVTAQEINTPQKSPDTEPEDPVEQGVPWESKDKAIEEEVSKQIADFAQDHSPAEAAARYSIDQSTVYRHLSVWTDEYDNEQEPTFSKQTINEPQCAVMREMGHDDKSLKLIKLKFDISHGAASKHVSAAGEMCSHDHNVPPVEFTTRISSDLCDTMRRAAHDGMTSRAIANDKNVSKNAVSKHVSSSRDCDCDNSVPAVVYD